MGYPGEPKEQPGANKSYTGCGCVLISYLWIFLCLICLVTAGRALGVIVPLLIPTVVIARHTAKWAKSPTVRQVAIYYLFRITMFCAVVPLFAALSLFSILR